MRRTAIKFAAASSLGILTARGFAGVAHMPDQRLLGSWKADGERTFAHWHFDKPPSERVRQHFKKQFSILTLRFLEKTVRSEENGSVTEAPYQLMAADARSAAIVITLPSGPHLEQLFFEEGYMYKRSARYNFEFFRRVQA